MDESRDTVYSKKNTFDVQLEDEGQATIIHKGKNYSKLFELILTTYLKQIKIGKASPILNN